jgi:hypothetical protein
MSDGEAEFTTVNNRKVNYKLKYKKNKHHHPYAKGDELPPIPAEMSHVTEKYDRTSDVKRPICENGLGVPTDVTPKLFSGKKHLTSHFPRLNALRQSDKFNDVYRRPEMPKRSFEDDFPATLGKPSVKTTSLPTSTFAGIAATPVVPSPVIPEYHEPVSRIPRPCYQPDSACGSRAYHPTLERVYNDSDSEPHTDSEAEYTGFDASDNEGAW